MGVIHGADGSTGASFTLDSRLARAAWAVVYAVLFRPSPRPCHGWRAWLLRLFGARIGAHAHVYPSVRIWAPWHLELGHHVGVGDGANLYSMAAIRIGDYCTVSQGAHLCGGSHDVDSENFQLLTGPIVLEANVWICAEAFVGMNVRVAEGAVVGARSVVVKNLTRPWTVYAGNPVRALRPRRRRQSAGDPLDAAGE